MRLGSESISSSPLNVFQILHSNTVQILNNSPSEQQEYILQLYGADEDYNFLPWEDYMFHFICKHIVAPKTTSDSGSLDEVESWDEYESRIVHRMMGIMDYVNLNQILDEFAFKLIQKSSVEYIVALFERRDSQGRTPLHVAVENFTVPQVLRWIPEGSAYEGCLNAKDAAGRTPLYTAAAIRRIWYYQVDKLVKDARTGVNAVFSPPIKRWPFDIDDLSRTNGYKGVLKDEFGDYVGYSATALHMVMIRGNGFSVECLLHRENLKRYATFTREVEFDGSLARSSQRATKFSLSPLQLAAMLFPTDSRNQVLDYMLKDDRFYDAARVKNLSDPRGDDHTHSALHYAAFSGNSEAVKRIIACSQFDCFTKDAHGNTALYFAVDVRGKPVRTHLLDRVNCWWTEYWNLKGQEDDLDNEKHLDHQREQTIDNLLQAGMDMWVVNGWGNRPNPGPLASQETMSRWDKRMETRTLEVQSRLNSAGGSISVTAALVATASYIGPLQPPLGYDSSTDRVEIHSLPLRIFIVCNTLSFYFAIAAISLALIPTLPVRGGAMISLVNELERLQSTMMVAAMLLFLSILFVVAAFAAASIAVISIKQSWWYGGLAVSTAGIGGAVCLTVMIVCLWRLVKPLLIQHPTSRKLYRLYAKALELPAAEKDGKLKYFEARRTLEQETEDAGHTLSMEKLDRAYSSDLAHSEGGYFSDPERRKKKRRKFRWL